MTVSLNDDVFPLSCITQPVQKREKGLQFQREVSSYIGLGWACGDYAPMLRLSGFMIAIEAELWGFVQLAPFCMQDIKLKPCRTRASHHEATAKQRESRCGIEPSRHKGLREIRGVSSVWLHERLLIALPI